MSDAPPATERAEARYIGMDTWSDEAILRALLDGQQRAVGAVTAAIPAIAKAADAAAGRLRAGGRLCYIAAGSPALMSLADALEIPQTFGIARDRIVLLFADGAGIAQRLDGGREDSADGARAEVTEAGLGPKDCVIGVSASGSTRYTVAGLEAAGSAGAVTIGIAGNRDAPLLRAAAIPVLIETGPEVLSGSTRLGAGTAQKAALNMLSTLVGVRLGHVHDGLMVNVQADNDKLRARAARIVMQIAQVGEDKAHEALQLSGGIVKPAVLVAAGVSPGDAVDLLSRHRDSLRAALDAIGAGPRPLATLSGRGLGR